MKKAANKLVGFLVLLVTLLLASCSQAPAPTENDALESQLVGGTATSPGAYPWMAQVWSTVPPSGQKCGGILIAKSWVVTAASCVGSSPSFYYVVLGDHMPFVNEGTEQKIKVKAIVKHPNYSPPSQEYNLALLELDAPATLDARVSLATIAAVPGPGTPLRVAGWGSEIINPNTNWYTVTGSLRTLNMARVSDPSCGFIFSASRFCGDSGTSAKRLAFNDVGDPIFLPATKQVVGLAGRRSANPSRYQQFTKLSPFKSWMDSHTKPILFIHPCLLLSRNCTLIELPSYPHECWVCDFELIVPQEENYLIRFSLAELELKPETFAAAFSLQLLTSDGKLIAQGRGDGREAMLELSSRLPKGEYQVRVELLDETVAKVIHADGEKYPFLFSFSLAK